MSRLSPKKKKTKLVFVLGDVVATDDVVVVVVLVDTDDVVVVVVPVDVVVFPAINCFFSPAIFSKKSSPFLALLVLARL